jgi:uncharacterized protein
MERHPRLARVLLRLGCLDTDPYALARGVSIGLLIGLTPTVGAQIVMMIVACYLFRGNFLAAFALSWVTNPLTVAPLYYGFHQMGELVFGPLLTPLADLSGLKGAILEESVMTLLGSLVFAIPAAITGYFICLKLVPRRKRTAPASPISPPK